MAVDWNTTSCKGDVALALKQLRDFSAVTTSDLLKAGEQQFGNKFIQ